MNRLSFKIIGFLTVVLCSSSCVWNTTNKIAETQNEIDSVLKETERLQNEIDHLQNEIDEKKSADSLTDYKYVEPSPVYMKPEVD